MRDFGKSPIEQNVYERDRKGQPVTPVVQSKKSKWQFRALLLLLVILIGLVVWFGANLFSTRQMLQQHAQKLGQTTSQTAQAPVTETPATTPAVDNPTQSVSAEAGLSTTQSILPAQQPKVTPAATPATHNLPTTKVNPATMPATSQTEPASSTEKAQPKQKAVTVAKPVFDFYKVLPEQQTVTPGPENEIPDQDRQFMLQVASYQTQQAAEQMRAQLILLGLKPQIDKIGDYHNIWYRVDIGPFDTMREADAARHILQNNGINGSMVRQIFEGN